MDSLTPAERSARMAQIRSSGTKPEITVKRALSGSGLFLRSQVKGIAGKPDLANKSRRIAIFVHGCFWHHHSCQAGRIPSTRPDFWKEKFLKNIQRDRRNLKQLRNEGWKVFIVWECNTRTVRDLNAVIRRIRTSLGISTA